MPDETPPSCDPPSAGPSSRRFTVRDVMVFVAAAAVGMLGYRANDATMAERRYVWGSGSPIEGWSILCGPGLATLTTGLAISRLFAPRPPRVELFRQAGFVAICVALTLTARRFLEAMLNDWLVGYDDWFLAMEWDSALQEGAFGILTTWTALALAGCLTAERGWVDRTSRAVGLFWVLAGIASRMAPPIKWAFFESP